MYNSIILGYTNNAYDFDSLREATASGLVETSYLAGLIRAMVTDVMATKRFTNKFAQFKKKRGYNGRIINSVYVNPISGTEFTVDGLSTLFDLAPADVKSSISKYRKPLEYTATYNKDELRTAFSSEEELTAFINKIISQLYNGAEIDDKNEFIKLFNDLINNNLVRFAEVDTITSDPIKDLGIALKAIVDNLKEESDKYNVWKRLNPHDTSAIFWSNPEDINIILPISINATLNIGLYAELFNVEKAELENRIFTVADDKLPEHVQAIVFDSTLVDIEEIYAELEEPFYDMSKRRYKEFFQVNNQYGVNPFANCVVLLDDLANEPSVDATAVRSKTVKIASGVETKIILDVEPLGANDNITAVATTPLTTTTATASYSDDEGWILTVEATADDTITFTGITGTITLDVE